MGSSSYRIALIAFLLSATAHALCLIYSPAPFAFDAYQRWGGRDHLLVQSWLPLGQSLLWLTADLGPLVARGLYSLIGSLTAALMVLVAVRIGGQKAGEITVAASAFGPFTIWTSTFYLEGPFLFFLFAGLLLALSQRLLAADLLIGLIGLSRYEGWPYLLVYLVWRRELKACRCLWGVALWLVIHYLLGLKGFHASPANYNDWEGLNQRFKPLAFLHDLNTLVSLAIYYSAGTWFIAGLVGAGLAWKKLPDQRPQVLLLLILLGGQLLITLFWMAGLEVPIARMTVIPTLLCAILAGVGIAAILPELPRIVQLGIPVARVILIAIGFHHIGEAITSEVREAAPELAVVERIERCPECIWYIEPRKNLGTRDRHDGCEVIQGLTTLRHGQDFYCGPWLAPEELAQAHKHVNAVLLWNGRRYQGY